jgi:hypothetical protein
MRLTTIYLGRSGLQLLATIHDGFLIECLREDMSRVREAINVALRQAVDQVFPGAPMRWDVRVFSDRYQDGDGKSLWEQISRLLRFDVPNGRKKDL